MVLAMIRGTPDDIAWAFISCSQRFASSALSPSSFGRPETMQARGAMTAKIARSILANQGIAAIWKLHEAAADAYRTGHPRSAAAVVEIAEAAEAAWLSARKRLRGCLADVIASLGTARLGANHLR